MHKPASVTPLNVMRCSPKNVACDAPEFSSGLRGSGATSPAGLSHVVDIGFGGSSMAPVPKVDVGFSFLST